MNIQSDLHFTHSYRADFGEKQPIIKLRSGYGRKAHMSVFKDSEAGVADLEHSLMRNFTSVRRLSGDTSSVDSMNTLKTWITTCDKKHLCGKPGATFSPDRLLKIDNENLVLREGLQGRRLKYACLSHCWGADGLSFKLTASNKPDLCKGIERSSLPKTFQDAAQLCNQLELKYLWIDALCIMQDDLGDWDSIAASMADIYRHAYLTIAATASHNSREGCFRTASAGAVAEPLRNTPGMAVRELRWPDIPFDVNQNLDDYPLLDRAWVFQERKMSRRMVHFTQAQLVWECQELFQSEDGVTVDRERCTLIPSGIEPDSTVFDWRSAVEEYSHLQLSFETDRLPAIAAIAQTEMESRKNDVYMAGMWRDTLLQDLLWHRISGMGDFDWGEEPPARPQPALPSWSWVSVKGPLTFKLVNQLEGVQITETTYVAEGQTHMGKYRKASITLRAPFVEALFLPSEFSPAMSRPYVFQMRAKYHDPNFSGLKLCGASADYNFMYKEPRGVVYSEKYAFMLTGFRDQQCWGLILRQCSDETDERVGLCRYFSEVEDLPERQEQAIRRGISSNLTIKEVRIV